MYTIRTLLFAGLLISTSAMAQQTLPNGGSLTGNISAAGAIGRYTFSANSGERLTLKVADTAAAGAANIYPRVDVYKPDGSLLVSTYGNPIAQLTNSQLPTTGVYEARVQDYYATATGPYVIHLAVSTGANEHGGLPNGTFFPQTLTIGDIDSYTFYGEAGNSVAVKMADTGNGTSTNVYPRFYIYKPDGTSLVDTYDADAAQVPYVALPVTGIYTIVAQDYYGTGVGPYTLMFARAPGANVGGGLTHGQTVSGTMAKGDIKTYTFYGTPGGQLSLTLSDTAGNASPDNIYPRIHVLKPNGSLLTTTYGSLTAQINNYALPEAGIYTIFATDYYGTDSGPYNLVFSCPGIFCTGPTTPPPPDLIGPENQVSDPTPTFSWFSSSGATWYQLWLQDERGVVHTQWYTDSSLGCVGGGTCTISPDAVTYGWATWWVQPWNSAGYGNWSTPKQYTTVTELPPAVQLNSPSGPGAGTMPTFNWTPGNYASWYRLWIEVGGVKVHDQWYPASTTNCLGGLTNCTLPSPVNFNGPATWWVQTWNSVGYGPWSAGSTFSAF